MVYVSIFVQNKANIFEVFKWSYALHSTIMRGVLRVLMHEDLFLSQVHKRANRHNNEHATSTHRTCTSNRYFSLVAKPD